MGRRQLPNRLPVPPLRLADPGHGSIIRGTADAAALRSWECDRRSNLQPPLVSDCPHTRNNLPPPFTHLCDPHLNKLKGLNCGHPSTSRLITFARIKRSSTTQVPSSSLHTCETEGLPKVGELGIAPAGTMTLFQLLVLRYSRHSRKTCSL